MTATSYGLFLDIQAAQSEGSADRGIGRFVAEHARALVARPGLVRGVAMHPLLPFPGHLPTDLQTSPLLTWGTATTFRRAERKGPLAYHVMSPFFPGYYLDSREQFLPPYVMDSGTPLVVTLYDLILLLTLPHADDPHWLAGIADRLEIVRNADLVLAISEYTRREALRLMDLDPERVVYIGAGTSPWFCPPLPGANPTVQTRHRLPQITRPFILCVSGQNDRKNTEALITAFAQLPLVIREAHQLVIACSLSPEFEAKWRNRAKEVGLQRNELILTDYVPDQILRALYQTASLSVFPSLLEGFGLPVAEAIACGCPTISSNTTSVPEILDWAPSTFDPTDSAAIAVAIEKALVDSDFRAQLRSTGLERARLHTWEAVADRTAAALERLPDPKSRRRGPVRELRIALVGPLPPTRSKVANYNARLIPELSCRCEVDVFSEQGAIHTLWDEDARIRHLPTSALGRRYNPSAYDAIVYAVGNSEHHHATYALAKRWSGIVWLHDVSFGQFYLTLGATQNATDMHGLINAKLAEQYGYAPRVPHGVHGVFNYTHEIRLGLRLTADWVRGARAVLTNSRFAEQLLCLDQGPDAQLPPIVRMPFGVPSLVNTDHIIRDMPPIIASFGHIEPMKQPELLIEALSLVRTTVPARLALVGPIEDRFRRDLQRLSVKLGVEEHVEITGAVSDAENQRWLWRTKCAAQFGTPGTGEMSAAIADCLGAGLPTLTNMVEICDEYVPDAVACVAPYFAVDELASRLTKVLTEPNVWERHHQATKQQALQASFSQVANELIAVAAGLANCSRDTGG